MALWGIAACPWGNNLKGTSLYLSVVIPLRYYSASLVVNKVHLCFFKSTAQSKAVHQNTCFVCTFFFFVSPLLFFRNNVWANTHIQDICLCIFVYSSKNSSRHILVQIKMT